LAIIAVLTGLILLGYGTPWTGFGEYISDSGEFQRDKTLWDWLELLLLPLVIAITVGVLAMWKWRSDRRQTELQLAVEREIAWRKVEVELQMADLRKDSHREASEIQARTERVIAKNRLNEETLNAYLDRMSELALERGLQGSDPDDEVRIVARARTLTALSGLDGERKGTILEFLYAAKLINMNDHIGDLMLQVDLVDTKRPPVDLSYADFSGAYLTATTLRGADLQEVDLRMADLRACDLSGANLRRADLTDADLTGARLVQANLREANLQDADLRSADLTGAVLKGAQMLGAQLSETDMGKSDLTAAALTTQQLKQAKSLSGATLRDGTKSG
jgi:uncharacterized protein YjbI with pentapeptide repeats